MREHIEELKQRDLPVPPPNPNPIVTIQNQQASTAAR